MPSPSEESLPRWKQRPFDSWDALKLLGLLLMFVDHSGAFFFPHQLWLRAIGRAAAPIFFFLVGYAASYRIKWDLVALAALMSISDSLLTGYIGQQNILVTIILCRLLFDWLEKTGRRIRRPYEWYLVALAFVIPTGSILQYGTLGLMFAMSGYMHRRPETYNKVTQQRFMILTFITYGLLALMVYDLPPVDTLLMAATLAGTGWLLLQMEIRPLAAPAPVARPLKWLSHYSGYIYAFHLIALEWLTGIPFS